MSLDIIRLPSPRAYPPRLSEFSLPFWNGLAEGRWLATRCDDCGHFSFPPKPFCPHCWHTQVTWTELSGQGKLYSHTTVHAAPEAFAADVPYRLCIVDIDEGLRVAAALVGDAPAIMDAPARAVVLMHKDGPLLAFTQDAPLTFTPDER